MSSIRKVANGQSPGPRLGLSVGNADGQYKQQQYEQPGVSQGEDLELRQLFADILINWINPGGDSLSGRMDNFVLGLDWVRASEACWPLAN